MADLCGDFDASEAGLPRNTLCDAASNVGSEADAIQLRIPVDVAWGQILDAAFLEAEDHGGGTVAAKSGADRAAKAGCVSSIRSASSSSRAHQSFSRLTMNGGSATIRHSQ